MSTLAWILSFTLLGGVLSALAASTFLALPEPRRGRLLPHLIGFATGALLAAALTGLLPRALEVAGAGRSDQIGLTLLIGLLMFFALEKFVLWRHCHHGHWETHTPSAQHRDAASGTIILVGDAIHNLVDGALIAAAFLIDIHVGVITAVAVFAHEVPQEVGDLAVLLHAGMSRSRAMLLNLLVSLTSVVGGVLGFLTLEGSQHLLPFALAIAASSFLYVAVADLIPGLHRRVDIVASAQQLAMIAAGAALIIAVRAGVPH